jgi:hypothetical protein
MPLARGGLSDAQGTTVQAKTPSMTRDPRQLIKAVVYSLLLVNFAYYVALDINVARHTLHAGWRWHDWTAAFATSLDETAWFVLLILLELETYLLDDAAVTPRRLRVMQGLRLLCIVFIAHTVIAFGNNLVELTRSTPLPETDLCELLHRDLSFARNLQYTEISPETCARIEATAPLTLFNQGQLVTDNAGLRVEWELAWADFAEVVIWLLILAMIELRVRLQDRGIASGAVFRVSAAVTPGLYLLLWCIAAYWAWRGHWVYSWDEALWILGFIAIGMNLSQWRDEIRSHTAGA